jgi:hypothetical protein
MTHPLSTILACPRGVPLIILLAALLFLGFAARVHLRVQLLSDRLLSLSFFFLALGF